MIERENKTKIPDTGEKLCEQNILFVYMLFFFVSIAKEEEKNVKSLMFNMISRLSPLIN